MKMLITLCGRGGSKGIPRKNLKLLNGIPLIVYSIRHALAFGEKYNADIALSTDDGDIKQVAAEYGVFTSYYRPEILANDNAGKIKTIDHLIQYEEKDRDTKYDYILDLDITSPLRNMDDLTFAFNLIDNDKKALNLFSVNSANKNPYFNMVEMQETGYYGLVKQGVFLTRQSAPKVYELNASFYFYRRAFFNTANLTTVNHYSLIYTMPHICFDLDHQIDFDFMEYLIANDKLDFSF
jgi:CMP-N,N'-diacetyllegionaminic acid synthase